MTRPKEGPEYERARAAARQQVGMLAVLGLLTEAQVDAATEKLLDLSWRAYTGEITDEEMLAGARALAAEHAPLVAEKVP